LSLKRQDELFKYFDILQNFVARSNQNIRAPSSPVLSPRLGQGSCELSPRVWTEEGGGGGGGAYSVYKPDHDKVRTFSRTDSNKAK
jgi:hypothetical protein